MIIYITDSSIAIYSLLYACPALGNDKNLCSLSVLYLGLTGDIGVTPSFDLMPAVEQERGEPEDLLASWPMSVTHTGSDGLDAGSLATGCPVTGYPLDSSAVLSRSNSMGKKTVHIGSPEIAETIMEDGTSRADLPSIILDEIKQQLDPSMQMPNSLLPHFSMSRFHSCRSSIHAPEIWPINRHIFQTCFPFHIIFDKDLVIRYMGISFKRIFPKAVETGALLSDYFVLNRPSISLTHTNICTAIHNVFIMSTSRSSGNKISEDLVQFRGQMVPTSSKVGADILFVGSPRVNTIEDLEQQGLYLSDIPVHDVTRDLILLNQHFHVERNTAALLQATKRDLEVEKAKVEHEKRRADRLLHSMLPPSIANELKTGVQSTAMDYESVTILFSDIKGFTTICNSCTPFQVVDMLNSLYSLFDDKSEYHKVYKVSEL